MVASCCENRSLNMFEDILKIYKEELNNDLIINKHINELYENLMEQNIQRILESYSHIEIEQLAKFLKLPFDRVYDKITEMILNKNINGNIDQKNGILTLFDENQDSNSMVSDLIATFDNLSNVVDVLYKKASKAV